ncbi:hypothetical protein ACQEVS_33060 [Streptomyces sp. CA-181903]|uniref:hypothetical protein n=1 Tax=Streptomyces sp. CA-181903 TaxID=3240055 RepID=UPI003D95090A
MRTGFPAQLTRLGQGTARAWTASRSTRRAARAKLRYARRVGTTLVLAAVAGILGKATRPWRWGSGKAAAIRMWNWRANRVRPKEDAQRDKEAAAAAAEARPPVKATVDDPGHAGRTTSRQGGKSAPEGTMNSAVFARAAEQVATAYASYSPPAMMAVAAEYQGLPEGLRSAASAIRHLALNTAEVYPAHRVVAEAVSAVYMRLLDAATRADEIHTTFRQVHADDLARHEAPRNGFSGEVMWNIGGRPGDNSPGRESVFARSCDAVAGVYARYEPAVMTEVQEEYASLSTGIGHLKAAVQSLAVHSADSYPVEPVIAEMVAGVCTLLATPSPPPPTSCRSSGARTPPTSPATKHPATAPRPRPCGTSERGVTSNG